jgi:hypothetical protein
MAVLVFATREIGLQQFSCRDFVEQLHVLLAVHLSFPTVGAR